MATQFITSLSKDPLALSETQQSRLLCNDLSGAGDECCVGLKWGFFFDGANNNLYDDKLSLTHSNVARLERYAHKVASHEVYAREGHC